MNGGRLEKIRCLTACLRRMPIKHQVCQCSHFILLLIRTTFAFESTQQWRGFERANACLRQLSNHGQREDPSRSNNSCCTNYAICLSDGFKLELPRIRLLQTVPASGQDLRLDSHSPDTPFHPGDGDPAGHVQKSQSRPNKVGT